MTRETRRTNIIPIIKAKLESDEELQELYAQLFNYYQEESYVLEQLALLSETTTYAIQRDFKIEEKVLKKPFINGEETITPYRLERLLSKAKKEVLIETPFIEEEYRSISKEVEENILQFLCYYQVQYNLSSKDAKRVLELTAASIYGVTHRISYDVLAIAHLDEIFIAEFMLVHFNPIRNERFQQMLLDENKQCPDDLDKVFNFLLLSLHKVHEAITKIDNMHGNNTFFQIIMDY